MWATRDGPRNFPLLALYMPCLGARGSTSRRLCDPSMASWLLQAYKSITVPGNQNVSKKLYIPCSSCPTYNVGRLEVCLWAGAVSQGLPANALLSGGKARGSRNLESHFSLYLLRISALLVAMPPSLTRLYGSGVLTAMPYTKIGKVVMGLHRSVWGTQKY